MVTYLQPWSRKPGHCSLQELQGWPRSGSSASGGCSGGVRHGPSEGGEGAGWKKSTPTSLLQGPQLHARACPTRVALGRLGQCPQRGGGDTTEVEAGQLRPYPYIPSFQRVPLPRPVSDSPHPA